MGAYYIQNWLNTILIFILFFNISTGNSAGGDLTLADLLERRGIQMSLFTSQDSETAENFLVNLSVLVVNKKYFYEIYMRERCLF